MIKVKSVYSEKYEFYDHMYINILFLKDLLIVNVNSKCIHRDIPCRGEFSQNSGQISKNPKVNY